MKPTWKAKPKIHLFLIPFIPLFQQSHRSLDEEVQTNKSFHLGSKEFTYIPTLIGHQPVYHENR